MLQCKRDNAEKIVMKIAIVNGNGGYSNQWKSAVMAKMKKRSS
jgi:hypothetical protein